MDYDKPLHEGLHRKQTASHLTHTLMETSAGESSGSCAFAPVILEIDNRDRSVCLPRSVAKIHFPVRRCLGSQELFHRISHGYFLLSAETYGVYLQSFARPFSNKSLQTPGVDLHHGNSEPFYVLNCVVSFKSYIHYRNTQQISTLFS